MNQDKIKNIIRQILVLVGTALMFLNIDGINQELIGQGNELIMQLAGVILDAIAFIGLIRAEKQSELSAAGFNETSISSAIKDVFKMQ